MISADMTLEERDFLALAREWVTYAVPRPDGTATAWAGGGIRKIPYATRERIGNALLARGMLRLGEAELFTNAVRIEVVQE